MFTEEGPTACYFPMFLNRTRLNILTRTSVIYAKSSIDYLKGICIQILEESEASTRLFQALKDMKTVYELYRRVRLPVYL